jgi:hypothetical protein
VEQLPQITVGLKDARAPGALHPLLQLDDRPGEKRREDQDRQDLGDLQQDVAQRHAFILRRRAGRFEQTQTCAWP